MFKMLSCIDRRKKRFLTLLHHTDEVDLVFVHVHVFFNKCMNVCVCVSLSVLVSE